MGKGQQGAWNASVEGEGDGGLHVLSSVSKILFTDKTAQQEERTLYQKHFSTLPTT